MAKSLLETLKNTPQQGGGRTDPFMTGTPGGLDPNRPRPLNLDGSLNQGLADAADEGMRRRQDIGVDRHIAGQGFVPSAPVDIPQGGTLPQAPPQTIGAQPFTPSFGAAPQAPVAIDEGLTPEMRVIAEQRLYRAQAQTQAPEVRSGRAQHRETQLSPDFVPSPIFEFGAPTEGRGGARRGFTAPVAEPTIATEAPSASPTPTQPQAPASDGSQIPKFGEEGFQFAERGSPQDFFLSQTNDGTTALSQEQIDRGQAFADQRGMNFDPSTGFSQGTEAAPQQGLTTAGGQPLGEFLAGGQQLDAQGRMINPKVDRSFFEQQSAEREARQAARPDFGEALSDRDRRAARGDGISDADRRDMAKANRPGASAGDVARGNKVAALVRVDLRTGRPLEGAGVETRTPEQIASDEAKAEGIRLDNERKQQVIEAGRKPDATNFEKFQSDLELSGLKPAAKRAALFKKFGLDPLDFPEDGGDTDSTGGTTSDAGSTPAASTEAPAVITTQAEYDALAVGTKYVDENGKAGTKK